MAEVGDATLEHLQVTVPGGLKLIFYAATFFFEKKKMKKNEEFGRFDDLLINHTLFWNFILSSI